MRFSYAEAMCDPSYYIPLAQAAEDAGYTSMVIPDSVLYPAESETDYPYTATGERTFLEGKPFIEPFSLIPALGAVTDRLRFVTFVMKLPIRNPTLVAKSVSSVAVMTKNRFGFGVGLSPWPEDFEACAQPWPKRGKRMDEMIEIIRGLTAGGFYEFHGEFYDIPKIKMAPIPSKTVPILIGGHSDAALERAARAGDGWMHAGGDSEELSRMLKRLAELRAEYGRESDPFEVHVGSADGFWAEGVKKLEAAGVTDAVVGFRNPYTTEPDTQTLQEKIDLLRRFADDVISKLD